MKLIKLILLVSIFLLLALHSTTTILSSADNIFLRTLALIDSNIANSKYLAKHKIDSNIILGIIKKESNFDPCSVSYKGAIGIMQLMPSTARMLKPGIKRSELFDIETNIVLSIKHLDNLCKASKTQKEAILKYYWGNKKPINHYYYWDIIRLSKKIKVGGIRNE